MSVSNSTLDNALGASVSDLPPAAKSTLSQSPIPHHHENPPAGKLENVKKWVLRHENELFVLAAMIFLFGCAIVVSADFESDVLHPTTPEAFRVCMYGTAIACSSIILVTPVALIPDED